MVPSDRNSTGNAVGVQSSPVSLARCGDLVVALPGPRQPGQVALDVGHQHRHAGRRQLLGDHLQRLRLAGARGAGDQAVPVDGGQRDADLRGRVDSPVDDDGAQFQRLALDGVAGGDLLCGGGCRLSASWARTLLVQTALPGGCGRLVVAADGLTVSAVRDELVWIDCEMTGLDLRSDRLIEIAVLVTDADLNILGDGIDVVIHADDDALSAMIDVVTEMHTRSGLIEEVRASTIDVPRPRSMVLDYIRSPRQAGQDRAAGRQLDRHRPRLHRPRHARRSTTTCTTG